MKKLIVVLCVTALLFACSKEEGSEFVDSPVIEAFLVSDEIFKMNISRQIPYSEDVVFSSDLIDELNVIIETKGQSYTLSPAGGGLFYDSSLMMEVGRIYNLSFIYNSERVQAYTYIPSKPDSVSQSTTSISVDRIDSTGSPGSGGMPSMPDPVEISWYNPDNSYYIVVVENVEAVLDPIREISEDEDAPENIFRNTPTTGNIAQLRAMEFEYFGTHRIILYHVLPDYADLYDQNSSSSQNLTSSSTSITNGYGIFTGINSDTLWLEVKEAK